MLETKIEKFVAISVGCAMSALTVFMSVLSYMLLTGQTLK